VPPRPSRGVLLAATGLCAACSLVDVPIPGGLTVGAPARDSGPDPGPDAAPGDGGLDAAVLPDASVDAALDASFDAGLDSGLDAGNDAGPPPSCDDLYGDVPGYILCEETEGTCAFNAEIDTNCADLCADLDQECLDAYDNPNDPGQECDRNDESDDCQTGDHSTELCVCTR